MVREHKRAELLRMAADNADQLFEDFELKIEGDIQAVLNYPDYNWRPVKTTKKIKRWLWSTSDGLLTSVMYSEKEYDEIFDAYPIKLLWSETEFEVDDE